MGQNPFYQSPTRTQPRVRNPYGGTVGPRAQPPSAQPREKTFDELYAELGSTPEPESSWSPGSLWGGVKNLASTAGDINSRMLGAAPGLIKRTAGSVVSGLESLNEFGSEVRGGAEDVIKGLGTFARDAVVSQFDPGYKSLMIGQHAQQLSDDYDYLKDSPSVGRGILRGGALATENLLGIPVRDIASDVSQGNYGRALGKGGMSLGIGLATHQAGKAAKSSALNRKWAGAQALPEHGPYAPELGRDPGVHGPMPPELGVDPGVQGPRLPEVGLDPLAQGPRLPEFGDPGFHGPMPPTLGPERPFQMQYQNPNIEAMRTEALRRQRMPVGVEPTMPVPNPEIVPQGPMHGPQKPFGRAPVMEPPRMGMPVGDVAPVAAPFSEPVGQTAPRPAQPPRKLGFGYDPTAQPQPEMGPTYAPPESRLKFNVEAPVVEEPVVKPKAKGRGKKAAPVVETPPEVLPIVEQLRASIEAQEAAKAGGEVVPVGEVPVAEAPKAKVKTKKAATAERPFENLPERDLATMVARGDKAAIKEAAIRQAALTVESPVVESPIVEQAAPVGEPGQPAPVVEAKKTPAGATTLKSQKSFDQVKARFVELGIREDAAQAMTEIYHEYLKEGLRPAIAIKKTMERAREGGPLGAKGDVGPRPTNPPSASAAEGVGSKSAVKLANETDAQFDARMREVARTPSNIPAPEPAAETIAKQKTIGDIPTDESGRFHTINTGHRIHQVALYEHKGRVVAKVIKDVGAAHTAMSAAKNAYVAKGMWFDLGEAGNTKALEARSGKAALTALDDAGNVRPGAQGVAKQKTVGDVGKPGEAAPTLYHGTRANFEHFEPTGGSGFGHFKDWNLFSENPEHAGNLYALGEHEGVKRNLPPDATGARTIAAKAGVKKVLDLTKPLSESDLKTLSETVSKKTGKPINLTNESPGYVADMVKSHYKDLPYDAVKFEEHGQTNWAVKPGVELKTPAGTPLSKPKGVRSGGEAGFLGIGDIIQAGRDLKNKITNVDYDKPSLTSRIFKRARIHPQADPLFDSAFETYVNREHGARLRGIKQLKEFSDLDNLGMKGVDSLRRGQNLTGRLADAQKTVIEAEKKLKGAKVKNMAFREGAFKTLFEDHPDIVDTAYKKMKIQPADSFRGILKNYKRGIDYGLEPKYKNVGEIVGWFDEHAHSNTARRNIAGFLNLTGQLKPSALAPKAGWSVVHPDVLSKLGIVKQITGKLSGGLSIHQKVEYKAPTKIAQALNNHFQTDTWWFPRATGAATEFTKNLGMSAGAPGTGISGHGINTIWRASQFGGLKGALKATKYAINPGGTEGMSWLGIGAPAKLIEKLAPWESAKSFVDNNMGKAVEAAEDGMTVTAEGKDLVKSGSTNLLGELMDEPTSKPGKLAKKGIDAVLAKHGKFFEDPLFQRMIPALKIGMWDEIKKDLIKRGVPKAEAGRTAAQIANSAHGGINWEAMQRSRNFQNVMKTIVLAPDWLESHQKIAKGMGRALRDPSNPKGRAYRKVASNMMMQYLGATLINKQMSGHWMHENASGHTLQIEAGKTDGKQRYVPLWGTGADFARLPMDAALGIAKGDLSPAFNIGKNRLSPPASAAMHIASGTDAFGAPIRGNDRFGRPIPMGKQLGLMAREVAEPISPPYVRGPSDYLTGRAGVEEMLVGSIEGPIRYSRLSTRKKSRDRPSRPQRPQRQ